MISKQSRRTDTGFSPVNMVSLYVHTTDRPLLFCFHVLYTMISYCSRDVDKQQPDMSPSRRGVLCIYQTYIHKILIYKQRIHVRVRNLMYIISIQYFLLPRYILIQNMLLKCVTPYLHHPHIFKYRFVLSAHK